MAWTRLPSRREVVATFAFAPALARAGEPWPSGAPIADVAGPASGWLGDDPERGHAHAIDPSRAFAGGDVPTPEPVDVVVVGGGLSGLAAAWRLREHAPVVLEAQAQLGGNARGERWNDVVYSLGGATLSAPGPRSLLSREFYAPLGLDRRWRTTTDEGFVLDRTLHHHFWSRASALGAQAVEELLRTLPRRDSLTTDPRLEELDRVTLAQELERVTGAPLHPQVRAFVDLQCRSALGGHADEVSAAAGLHLLCAATHEVAALPGGPSPRRCSKGC